MDYSSTVTEIMSRRRFGKKPGIEVCHKLLKKLGYPERSLRIIHIAGTNGKGSVAHFTAGALSKAGHRTGLFTSPHLMDFRERIMVDGRMIPPEEVILLYERIKALGGEPTMFDITFLMALLFFAREGCEYAVIETGLGGRLDSTSAISISPEVCVITSIGLDHTEVLGDTLEEIALEKAGIIKAGSHVVTGPMDEDALCVIKNYAMEVGAGSVMALDMGEDEVFSKKDRAISRRVLEILGVPSRDVDTLPPVRGRFYTVSTDPVFIIDGAHNPQAAGDLVKSLKAFYPGKRYIFLLGALEGHDTTGFIRELLPVALRFYTVGISDGRAKSAGELYDIVESLGAEAYRCESLSEAIKRIKEDARDSGSVAVACGSFYLIGEILDEIQFTP